MPSIELDNVPFPTAELEDPVRNIALGKYMTAWGQLEVMWSRVFRNLCGIQGSAANVVFDRISTSNQLTIIGDLSKMLPRLKDRTMMQALVKDIRAASEQRNRIIHASWGLIGKTPARFYRGLLSSQIIAIAEGSAEGLVLRKTSVFTVADIDTVTAQTVNLRDRTHEAGISAHPLVGTLDPKLEAMWRDLNARHGRDPDWRPSDSFIPPQ